MVSEQMTLPSALGTEHKSLPTASGQMLLQMCDGFEPSPVAPEQMLLHSLCDNFEASPVSARADTITCGA